MHRNHSCARKESPKRRFNVQTKKKKTTRGKSQPLFPFYESANVGAAKELDTLSDSVFLLSPLKGINGVKWTSFYGAVCPRGFVIALVTTWRQQSGARGNRPNVNKRGMLSHLLVLPFIPFIIMGMLLEGTWSSCMSLPELFNLPNVFLIFNFNC